MKGEKGEEEEGNKNFEECLMTRLEGREWEGERERENGVGGRHSFNLFETSAKCLIS